MSSSSRERRVFGWMQRRLGAALSFAVALGGCSREDIELAPPPSGPPPVEDCSARVPEGLLAARPPMGWNGYNAFPDCTPELDETKLRANIDALVATGMQSAGYQYVNLDECWQLPRGADGLRAFDPVVLPGGIEALSNDVHARGLSLGVWAPHRDCNGDNADDVSQHAGCAAHDPIPVGVELLARWGCRVGCIP